MRTVTTLVFLFCVAMTFAQEKQFLLQGQVLDQAGKAVSDVYVVNLNNYEKDISRTNGVFSIWVLPGDSLVFSHISYSRKVKSVSSILIDPHVTMVSEHVAIPEIIVNPEQKSDLENARDNLKFLNDYDPPKFEKIDPSQNDPVSATLRENNRIMRVEAASVSILRFSPSTIVGNLFKNKRKRDRQFDYKSTRKVVAPPPEEED